MPYTPPSPSPNVSFPHSRTNSRSSSFSEISSPPSSVLISPSSPQHTRSTSYLHKHRRSVGASRPGDDKPFVMSPPSGISSGPILHPPRSASGSIRQIQTVPMMSTGVVISPPDSSQNSSDDEADIRIKRGRQLVDVAELEAAIRNTIQQQRREASPINDPKRLNEVFVEPRSPEMLSARIHQKISHARSTSDISGARELVKQAQMVQREQQMGSQDSSPDIEDDAYRIAPAMVRKKSGELVKSSLKSPNLRRRPSSMPSTPTYPKVVHFDSHLEHVRHFLYSERPAAVSAGSSPVESAIENDREYPFPSISDEPPFEWEICLPNFPDRLDRSSWVVRVEKVVLSHDKKALLGTVAVANLSFQKLVVARFTLDYWQTTSEVAAEFTNDVRRKQLEDGYDRFTFKIRLEDMANLENKTLFFCVRYRVGDQEYWDNNSSINYQVDFKKKAVPQMGKSGPSTTSSRPLPRSKPTNPTGTRPRSMPIFDDAFDAYDLKTQPEYKMFAAVPQRQQEARPAVKPLKKQQFGIADPEALARRANPSGNAFGNRYDFEASLAAAMATATKVLGPERSGIKLKASNGEERVATNPYFHNLTSSGLPRSHSSPSLSTAVSEKTIPRVQIETTESFTPSLDALKTLGSEKPPIESTSYKEILENFCFFGSAKPSPQLASGALMPTQNEQSSGAENSNTLSVSNYTISGPRSPSPTSHSRPVDGADGLQFITSSSGSASSLQGSQKGSRSPSPSHNAYGFPSGTPFDFRTPSIIKT